MPMGSAGGGSAFSGSPLSWLAQTSPCLQCREFPRLYWGTEISNAAGSAGGSPTEMILGDRSNRQKVSFLMGKEGCGPVQG